jgi:hypothetical protein
MFKEATAVVRNSLIAAVGFVDSTLAAQRSAGQLGPEQFGKKLETLALDFYREPLHQYRQWALLTLVLVGLSVLLVLGGVALGLSGQVKVAVLTSISSIVSGLASTLLYKRLDTAQRDMNNARDHLVKQLSETKKVVGAAGRRLTPA